MQIVTGRRGEPHITSRQMQAVYRSFLGDFALLDIGEKLRAEAYSNDIVRVYDGVVSVQGIYAVIAYNQYDEVYIEPVSVGKKRIDTIVLHYTKNNTLDVEDMQLDVVQGEEYTDNPIAPVVPEGGDAWEGTTDIQVPIYDVEVTNFGLTVIPHARMLTVIPTLDSIAERIPKTVVTGVKGDSEVLYRDGDVNITKANIGLGSVDNTADTDKPISTATQTALNLKADLTYVDAKISAAYHAGGSKTVAELTSALLIADNIGKVYNMSDSGVTTSDFVEGAGEPINEGDNVGICNIGTEESPVYKFDLLSGFVDLSAYATTSAVNTGLAGKVDKVTGKGLSTEDYTTTDKTKLAGISEGATQTIANPADTATEMLSKLKVGGVVYDIPQGASGATELSELTDVNLSNVEDNDILQYDETANKWKNSNALQGAKTATGNPITVTDAAPVNAVNLSMDLEPVQDLHGYDHPWVGGAGKNKLPMTLDGMKASNTTGTWSGNTYTIDGVTFTVETDNDGNVIGIDLNGTSTDDVQFNICDMSFSIGDYTLNDSATFNDTMFTFVQNKGGTNNSARSLGFTTTSAEQRNVGIYINGTGISLSHIKVYPMIRLSTETDATFEPYSNISPITGQTEVVIENVGKNLWSYGDVSGILYSDIQCNIKAGTYTLSALVTSSDTDKTKNAVVLNDSDGNTIQQLLLNRNSRDSATFTADRDIKSITFYASESWYASRDDTLSFKDIQLELGNTATTYEPYKGKTYTIQLGDTVYSGTLDVITGKMRVTHGYVEYSSVKGTGAGGTFTFDCPQNMNADVSDAEVAHLTSDKLKAYSISNVVFGGIIGIAVSRTSSVIYARFPSSYGTTTSDIDAKLAVDPLQVVYELATPYTIQLTPTQIKMLENTNTIYTDYNGDIITIEYQPNNSIGEAVRAVEESYDPEFAVRPVLKKKAFSGTTDTDGSVTLINASDIPSGHKIIPLQITDMKIDGSAGTYFVEYEPYNSGDSVKGYCYFYMSGSQMFPVGKAITGNFYYYELEV